MFLLAPEANLPRPAPVLAVPAGNWQVKVGIAVPAPDVTLLTEHSGSGLQVLSPNVVVFTRAKLVNVRAALPAEELGRTTSVTVCVSPLANVPMLQLMVLLRGRSGCTVVALWPMQRQSFAVWGSPSSGGRAREGLAPAGTLLPTHMALRTCR